MDKIIAFDIESAALADDFDFSKRLGVTCAATFAVERAYNRAPYTAEDGELRLWHGDYAPQMSPAQLLAMLEYLRDMRADGYTIVAWNSVGFDFRIIYNEMETAAQRDLVKDLARTHFDPGFTMLCEKGFMAGLDATAQGFGLAGKLDGMSGVEAVTAWTEGCERQDLVLEYVAQDAIATANVVDAMLRSDRIQWVSKRGNRCYWRLPEPGARRVHEAQASPRPLLEQDWMRERETASAWLFD